MKILCICDAGQVRSVAMAFVLRNRGHFAVAGSYDNWNNYGADSLKYFDLVLEMQEGGCDNIGRDEYGDPVNLELLRKCYDKLQELEEAGRLK